MFGALLLEQAPQIVSDREYSAFAILRRSRIEPDFSGREVDLAPLERQYFRDDSPAGDVGEFNNWLKRNGQMCVNARELFRLEKPSPRVVFL